MSGLSERAKGLKWKESQLSGESRTVGDRATNILLSAEVIINKLINKWICLKIMKMTFGATYGSQSFK
jgi:hypothetical protein